MFQRSGENAWETHCSWSMEVTVYIFCYLCVKCSLNEGHYLTIYCRFSPKGGKMDVPKVWVSRQENGIGINSKSFFFFVFFFALRSGFLLGIMDGFCGWKQREKEGRQQKRRELRDRDFCLRNSEGRTLSLFHNCLCDGQKLLQVMPVIAALCL